MLQQTELRVCLCLQNALEQNSESLLLFLFRGTKFQVVFSSAERFGTEFQVFASIFSAEWKSELFSLLRKGGSEQDSKSLLLFMFLGMKFCAFFSSAEWFGMEFREISVPRNSGNSAGTNQWCCLLRLPRNNYFVRNLQP
jgi:hypothetical protein